MRYLPKIFKNKKKFAQLNNLIYLYRKKMDKLLNGFNNGRDTTEGVGGNKDIILTKDQMPPHNQEYNYVLDNFKNPADKGCIIYVDNDNREISRDYLRSKLLNNENPI